MSDWLQERQITSIWIATQTACRYNELPKIIFVVVCIILDLEPSYLSIIL